jgi:hypothetical protein
MSGHGHSPDALLPGKKHGTHFIGESVGRRTSLDGCGKFDPLNLQPVASRYIDYAIPGNNNNNNNNNQWVLL